MGWFDTDSDPDGRHEGYIVGLVPAIDADGEVSTWRFRELSSAAGDDPGAIDLPLSTVQAGCDCGWRSPRMQAPHGTVWVPFSVIASEWLEEQCRQRWREHVTREADRREDAAQTVMAGVAR